MSPTPLIEFRDAGAAFGGRWIWRSANLTVDRGAFVAVIGPNGAGKTTLLKMALGAIAPAEGSVLVDGAPPRRGSVPVGYAPQARPTPAGTGIRARDLVRLGVDGRRWGVPLLPQGNAEADRRVDAALKSVSAREYASRRIGQLSGGELQRAMLAQALVRSPCLLALDEPLANLDIKSRRDFITLVAGLTRARGVAVLAVTHDLNGLWAHLDKVVCVAGGVVEAGDPERLVTSDALSRLYGAPIEVLRDSAGGRVIAGLGGTA